MTLEQAYIYGCHSAFQKFALEIPTQVDAFMGAVESGKDVLPEPALAPMEEPPLQPPPMMGALG